MSALKNKLGVQRAIMKELDRGHTSGPFKNPPFDITHCSPIGAVVKKDDSCRLIMDLSQPRGGFDTATDMVRAAGIGCLLSKVDIQHAFRLLPVHPSNWPLLGNM